MTRTTTAINALCLVGLMSTFAPPAFAASHSNPEPALEQARPTLTGRTVIRDGFHFQVAFGWGGGYQNMGLFHAMEIGGTLDNGITLALLHTFIQNKGLGGGTYGGPDLIGGWMPEIKFPLLYDDLILKFGIGLGGTHDQSHGIKATAGLGWFYGVDFNLPLFRRSGLTLGAQVIHVWIKNEHHFGASLSLGYTFF